MIIRKPNPNETEAIIQLLRASLGESLLKKSARIWKFKHEENPFGTSPILVAEDNGTLIGVRALMQWRWQFQDDVWVSYRAVDTATHPDHQGKGIFRMLTMKALEEVQKIGESFVFNTPNKKSRPGYFKMGWQPVGKIRLALVPAFFYCYRGLFSSECHTNSIMFSQLEQICETHNKRIATKNVLFTPKSASYLKWRYEDNPMQNYIVVSTSDWYIAMYVKKHRYFNEMRVAEVIGDLNPKNRKQIQQSIVSYGLKNRCTLLTVADENLFKLKFFGNFGPLLTFRSLSTSEHINKKALRLENWCYSLGDLELF